MGLAGARDRSAAVAYVAAAVNLVAGAAMLFVLRPGVAAGDPDLAERIAYVREHVAAWRAGWFVWNLAALSLLAFYVVLSLRWRARAPVLCRVALLAASAGLAADVGAETLFMVVQPGLDAADFKLVEDAGIALTGYLGNGLYVVAGILLTAAGARELPRALVASAGVVWALGVALSVSTLVRSEDGQFWSAALLMPSFVAWTVLIGRWMQTRAS